MSLDEGSDRRRMFSDALDAVHSDAGHVVALLGLAVAEIEAEREEHGRTRRAALATGRAALMASKAAKNAAPVVMDEAAHEAMVHAKTAFEEVTSLVKALDELIAPDADRIEALDALINVVNAKMRQVLENLTRAQALSEWAERPPIAVSSLRSAGEAVRTTGPVNHAAKLAEVRS